MCVRRTLNRWGPRVLVWLIEGPHLYVCLLAVAGPIFALGFVGSQFSPLASIILAAVCVRLATSPIPAAGLGLFFLLVLMYALGSNHWPTLACGLAAVPGWMWCMSRRAQLAHAKSHNRGDGTLCPTCEYDMRGVRSPICPECGTNVLAYFQNQDTGSA